MQIQEFFDKATSTLTYLVWDPATKDAVAIDPVLDYDPAASTVAEDSVGKVIAFLEREKLLLHYILETHAHADHVSGAQSLKARFSQAKVAIGARIAEVQKTFREVFDLPASFRADGSQFDELFTDEQVVRAGSLAWKVLYTPGHTAACSSYVFDDAVFTGDALFMPDGGVGRCDFPGGCSKTLYHSVTQRLYTLAETTRTFTGHDYQPNGRELRFQSTIGEHKKYNLHLKADTTEAAFVKFRTERDKTLSAPKLLLPSVQLNINAGQLPPPHENGRRYLYIPISPK